MPDWTGTAHGHGPRNCFNWFECVVCMGYTEYTAGQVNPHKGVDGQGQARAIESQNRGDNG